MILHADEAVASVRWNDAGDLLAIATLAGTVVVLDTSRSAPHPRTAWKGDVGDAVTALDWSRLGPLAVGGLGGTVTVWQPATGERGMQLRQPVTDLRWHPRHDILALGSGSDVLTCRSDLTTVSEAPFLDGTVRALAWADGPGELAVGGRWGIRWLTTESPPPLELGATYETDGTILAIATDPAGARLASGDTAGILRITDLVSGEEVALSGYPDRIDHLAWDRAGVALAVPADDEITVWFVDPGAVEPANHEPECLHGPEGRVTCLGFHPIFDVLVSGDVGGCLCIWNAGDVVRTIELANGITSLDLHPRARRVAVGTRSGQVHLFDLGVEHAPISAPRRPRS